MLRMVSHPHRPQSGHIMCYLNRTYHVLPTRNLVRVDQGRSMDVMFANGSPELDQGDQYEETGFSLFRIQPDRL